MGALFNSSGATPTLFCPLWPFHLTTSQPTYRNAEWDRNNGRHYQGRPAYSADDGRMPHMVQAAGSGLHDLKPASVVTTRMRRRCEAAVVPSLQVYCLSDLSPVTKRGPAGVLWKHRGIEAHAEHPLAKHQIWNEGTCSGANREESRVC